MQEQDRRTSIDGSSKNNSSIDLTKDSKAPDIDEILAKAKRSIQAAKKATREIKLPRGGCGCW